jgi:hypothetical protein
MITDEQFAALLAKLDRVADAMEHHAEANAALFGLLVSGGEAEPAAEVASAIPKTLED